MNIFANWTGWTSLKTVLSALTAVSAGVVANSASEPAWAVKDATAAGLMLASATVLVVVLSGSSMNKSVTKVKKP